MRLDGKTVLVTGASRGIGKAIAIKLANAGATVIGTATGPVGTMAIDGYMEELKLKGRARELELGDPNSIESLIGGLTDEELLPDILVNNAGITRDTLLLRLKDEDWDAVISTNLSGIYRLTKLCLRSMLKARSGRIISITSVVAQMGNAGQSNYAAAKAGIIGFSKSIARELGPRGITVNTIAPGFIDTDMTRELSAEQRALLLDSIPLRRLGKSDEIAAAVLFLASDEAAYITGETLSVNGGMFMS